MRQRRGDDEALRRREGEQAALLGFLRRLLATTPAVTTMDGDLPVDPAQSPEIERLVGVAQAVLSQESASR
jgi:hypothetical protein